MKKGKLSAAERAQRRQEIIDHIRQAGSIKSGDLCAELGVSRSSLSDDMKVILATTPQITSPKKGFYTYHTELAEAAANSPLTGIDRKHLRRWMILFLLSQTGYSFEDLQSRIADLYQTCGTSTLHTDLHALEADGLIVSYKDDSHTFYRSNAIKVTNPTEIRNYLHHRVQTNSRIDVSAHNSISDKIHRVLPDLESDQVDATESNNIRRVGKHNRFDEDKTADFIAFSRFPYKTHRLWIQHRIRTGELSTTECEPGMIVYSVETNRIYLFARVTDGSTHIIPLDSMVFDTIRIVPRKYNYYWNSRECQDMYRQMISISSMEPVQVRVRFVNLRFVEEKVMRLHLLRPDSELTYMNDNTELLYTDTIRGIEDFARYLRRFGRSAIVQEPEALRNMMISTSQKVISLYCHEDVKHE